MVLNTPGLEIADFGGGLNLVDDEEGVSCLLGRNTITVFPTVVRNSSKPKTV